MYSLFNCKQMSRNETSQFLSERAKRKKKSFSNPLSGSKPFPWETPHTRLSNDSDAERKRFWGFSRNCARRQIFCVSSCFNYRSFRKRFNLHFQKFNYTTWTINIYWLCQTKIDFKCFLFFFLSLPRERTVDTSIEIIIYGWGIEGQQSELDEKWTGAWTFRDKLNFSRIF